jgi:hypothetical protein
LRDTPWDGTVNFSAYAEVETASRFASEEALETYRAERLARCAVQVEFMRAQGVPAGGLRVADVGSGSSAFLYALERADLLDHAIGIELSESRHRFAEQWRLSAGFGRVTNVCSDFVRVVLDQNAFDRFTVLDDTYLYLSPESDRYPARLFDVALGALTAGGLFVASFRNDVPLAAAMPGEGRSFWVELAPSNGFTYALYRQDPSPDRRVLRNESRYIGRDSSEARKVEITEVCDANGLVEDLLAAGFAGAAAFDGFCDVPFDVDRSRQAVVVARK